MIASRSMLGKIVAGLGLFIGLTVAIAAPAGYLLVAYAELGHELSLLAELKATRLAKYIYLHHELWRYHTDRLAELTEIPEAKEVIARQRIFDSAGQPVVETGEAPVWPVMARSVPVLVAGLPAAAVETATTVRHILIRTAVVAAVSSALGLAVFFVVRILPLRIIDRTLAELEATQARLLATIDAIPIEFMEYNREGRLMLINSAARVSQGWNAESLGKTQRELLEKTLSERRVDDPEHDWEGWMTKRMATLEQMGSFELTRPTGESGRFFVKDMPGGGRVVLRIDITESKRREAEHASTQARYRLLFDANPFPMVVIQRDSLAFLAVNGAAVERYGWSREEFLTMTFDDLHSPHEVPPQRMIDQEKSPMRGAATFAGQRHRRKDGTVFEVEVTSRAIEFDGQPAALALAVDVTQRNRVEEQLRQSQKMEAVGQLTGGIAHDFNNILTIILANIDMLEEEELGPTVEGRLKGIAGAVDRAVELTRQLLSFSRKQPLRARVTDVNELVTATAKLLRRSLGSQVEVDAALFSGLWPVKVDRPQLDAALVNLCVNARDAMPDGGKLLIETRNATLDDDYVVLNPDVVAGDYMMLAVTDTGMGMAPGVLARAFDPFFTTKEAGKGTGLGLSMVYGFIKQSKGHIKVASEPGRGTTFRIYLPRTAEAVEEAATREQPAMPRGDERVLVVEDEPGVCANTVEQLRSLGYDVSHAMDGAAGLVVLESARKPYDLVLTDVMMPRLNGKAFAEAVAHRWPKTRIVFMSGYAEDAIVHHGIIDVGVLLLSKPFRKSELAQMVRQALDAPKLVALASTAA